MKMTQKELSELRAVFGLDYNVETFNQLVRFAMDNHVRTAVVLSHIAAKCEMVENEENGETH